MWERGGTHCRYLPYPMVLVHVFNRKNRDLFVAVFTTGHNTNTAMCMTPSVTHTRTHIHTPDNTLT